MIIGSIFHHLFNFSVLDFLLIVLFAFVCDFDIFFSKYALENNHRMLISHSIIPGLIIVILGLIFNWLAFIIGGFSYLIHIIIDTFDWGTNFFYFQKKQVGLKLLISKEEFNNISKYLSQYKRSESFFDGKYYGNILCLIIEALAFILMMILIVIFALEYFAIIIVYFIFLTFHLQRHFKLKKIESN
ncbi:MAG: hypothetical protein ACFFEO_11695 [Candidatus Thorarchaeota archaeon]